MFDYETKILEHCTVDVKDAYKLSDRQFADIRRNGIGASDASVILGTNPWAKIDETTEDKLATGQTAKNIEIGEKPNVRKGKDLEPLILEKAAIALQRDIVKPLDMYRLKKYPWLTINYDGIAFFNNQFVPVEAKMVSPFGEKGWDWTKSWSPKGMASYPALPSTLTPKERCEFAGQHYGIPAYYYCQLQQQMMGLGSQFGFMAALHDKDWTLRLYMVLRDNHLIIELIRQSRAYWNQIARIKGLPTYEATEEMQVPNAQLAKDEDY